LDSVKLSAPPPSVRRQPISVIPVVKIISVTRTRQTNTKEKQNKRIQTVSFFCFHFLRGVESIESQQTIAGIVYSQRRFPFLSQTNSYSRLTIENLNISHFPDGIIHWEGALDIYLFLFYSSDEFTSKVANLFVLFSFHFLVSSIVFLPRSPFPL
jgi:hypothetical protein